jgi:hypothetical protein
MYGTKIFAWVKVTHMLTKHVFGCILTSCFR